MTGDFNGDHITDLVIDCGMLDPSYTSQTVEQDDGSFHLIGRHFQTGGIGHCGNGLVATSCQTLSLAGGWIDGSVEEQARDQLTRDPVLLDELS
jgi:hypothetical protein